MKEINQHSRIEENFPGVTYILANHLNFNVTNDFGDDILILSKEEIKNIDPYMKRYLNDLAAITHLLSEPDQPIPMEEYLKYVKCLREATSSGLSYLTPDMVKAESLDSEISEIGWRIFNFTWCMGYYSKRYH